MAGGRKRWAMLSRCSKCDPKPSLPISMRSELKAKDCPCAKRPSSESASTANAQRARFDFSKVQIHHDSAAAGVSSTHLNAAQGSLASQPIADNKELGGGVSPETGPTTGVPRSSAGPEQAEPVPELVPPSFPPITFSVTYEGCDTSPYDAATIQAAARTAYDTIKSTECVKDGAFRHKLLQHFNGLTIACEQCDNNCGHSKLSPSLTIYLCKPALNQNTCGPIASTILHEVVHKADWSLTDREERPTACEKSCFGYGSGNPDKCK